MYQMSTKRGSTSRVWKTASFHSACCQTSHGLFVSSPGVLVFLLKVPVRATAFDREPQFPVWILSQPLPHLNNSSETSSNEHSSRPEAQCINFGGWVRQLVRGRLSAGSPSELSERKKMAHSSAANKKHAKIILVTTPGSCDYRATEHSC